MVNSSRHANFMDNFDFCHALQFDEFSYVALKSLTISHSFYGALFRFLGYAWQAASFFERHCIGRRILGTQLRSLISYRNTGRWKNLRVPVVKGGQNTLPELKWRLLTTFISFWFDLTRMSTKFSSVFLFIL